VHDEHEECDRQANLVTNDAAADIAACISERERGVKHIHADSAGCPFSVDIIDVRNIDGEIVYLLRLMETCEMKRTYFLKRYDDFKRLVEELRDIEQNRCLGDLPIFAHLPALPTNGRFGFRRSLSKLGVSDFINRQRQDLQQCIDTLLRQVPDLNANRQLQTFFCSPGKSTFGASNLVEEQGLEQEKLLMNTMIAETRAFVTLETLQGYWRLTTSQRTWQVFPDGIATLDGRHRGHQYDFIESGSGAERRIMRPDGWEIDLDRSTDQRLIWIFPGQAEVEWSRVDDDVAEAALKKVQALRESIRQKAEAKRKLERGQTGACKLDAQERSPPSRVTEQKEE